MFADQIEQIQSEWTDKYVVVDATRPELKRFGELVGQVKTVNMNGQALVEFADYHLNVAWYDIACDCLTVVPKPEPKAADAKKAKKAAKPAAAKKAPAAGGKKLSPLEMARQQGASGGAAPAAKSDKPAAGDKKSTADILAAARGGSGSTAKPVAEQAAAPATNEGPPKVDRAKMSVADMLAAARGGQSDATAAAPSEPAVEEPAAVEETVAETAEPSGESAEVARVDKSSMSVDDMVAHCREVDG